MGVSLVCNKMRRLGWRPWHVPLAGALVVAAVAAVSGVWADVLALAMRDEESSQIWLALPIAAYIVWVRLPRLTHVPRRHLWVGPALAALGWAMIVAGDRHLWQSVWHAGAVVMAVGAALSVLGGSTARRVMPALLALAFLVPIPARVRQRVAIPLQEVTATATATILGVVGSDVVQSGNLLSIGGEQVTVAEACNGMRMTFSLLAACYALAFGLPLKNWVRLLVLAAAPLVAVVCNVVRLVPTVWLFGAGPRGLAEAFHDVGGWAMLVVSLMVLVGLLRLLEWRRVPIFRLPVAAVHV